MKSNGVDDDKMLFARADDVIELSYKHRSPKYLGFLNEHQAQLIKDNISLSDCAFWGGYEDATRVVFGCNVSDNKDFPITALEFKYKDEFMLSHRDFLGALMSLGIERSTIGDILTNTGQTIVFVKSEISDHIKREIDIVGRVRVEVSEIDITDIHYVSNFDELKLTLSSLRLDVFVCAVCNLSRDKSQKLIKSELVAVNHNTTDNVSKTLSVGDVITIRKFGKFVFTDEHGVSKKGKLKITVKHFR